MIARVATVTSRPPGLRWTLNSARAFARTLVKWGVNADAVDALEEIAEKYDLKPALVGEINPEIPTDQRGLPQPMP